MPTKTLPETLRTQSTQDYRYAGEFNGHHGWALDFKEFDDAMRGLKRISADGIHGTPLYNGGNSSRDYQELETVPRMKLVDGSKTIDLLLMAYSPDCVLGCIDVFATDAGRAREILMAAFPPRTDTGLKFVPSR